VCKQECLTYAKSVKIKGQTTLIICQRIPDRRQWQHTSLCWTVCGYYTIKCFSAVKLFTGTAQNIQLWLKSSLRKPLADIWNICEKYVYIWTVLTIYGSSAHNLGGQRQFFQWLQRRVCVLLSQYCQEDIRVSNNELHDLRHIQPSSTGQTRHDSSTSHHGPDRHWKKPWINLEVGKWVTTHILRWRPLNGRPGLPCDVQRRCSCSCRL